MRLALILFAALVLGGCLQDRPKDIATCGAQADRFFQGYNAADVENPRSRYVIACMSGKGYNFDVSRADCDSRHSLVMQPNCYVRESWMASIIDRFLTHR